MEQIQRSHGRAAQTWRPRHRWDTDWESESGGAPSRVRSGGLAPARLQQGYLVDPTTIDFKGRKGPSTAMGCQLCAGVAATEALKILLKRGKVIAAPRGVHFDAYCNKAVTTWVPGGNANPLKRLTIALVRRKLGIAPAR